MWVVVEREVTHPSFMVTLQIEATCVYDLCDTDGDGVAIRVATFTDKPSALRACALLNRHGMVDEPIPQGLLDE